MCGIVGLVSRTGTLPEGILEGLTARIAHRGPDGEGVMTRNGVGFGHRRLSIIDPASGAQPMLNRRGSVWLTFNGEIYNYIELKKELISLGFSFRTTSDTEVLLHAWEAWGTEAVARLRGMFAFAIADWDKGVVFLARDHLGIKPLYYADTPDLFAFCSEIGPLTALPGFDAGLDMAAIDQYLWLQYVPAPATIFKQVRKLPPGHQILLSMDGRIKEIRRHWDVRFEPEEGLSARDWEDRVDTAVSESVKAHLVSDVPFGAFLSGGVDSSLIVTNMSRILTEPVRTFSIGFMEAEFNESAYAEQAARICHTSHRGQVLGPEVLNALPDLVSHYGEPFGDSSALPTWFVSKLARSEVPMVLSGDGADEMFAGYYSYGSWMDSSSKELANWLQRIEYIPPQLRSVLWRPELRKHCSPFLATFEEEWSRARNGCHLHQAQYMDLKTYLPFDILTKVDIASMAHGLEVRTPFVDRNIVEVARRIPASHSLVRDASGNWSRKEVLKRVAERYFPADFIRRKKMGFAVPIARWFSQGGSARAWLEDRLLGAHSALAEYFTADGIRLLLQHNMTGPLWLLLFLDEWLRQQGMQRQAAANRPVSEIHLQQVAEAVEAAQRLMAATDTEGAMALLDKARSLLPQDSELARNLDDIREQISHSQAEASPRARPRILLVADVPNWIFARHCQYISNLLGDEFDFETTFTGRPIDEDRYDLIYALSWNMVEPTKIRQRHKLVAGIRSHISWNARDPLVFAHHLNQYYQATHVVSEELHRIFAGRVRQLYRAAHGMDVAHFTPAPRAARNVVRVGWAGNRNSPAKGFAEFIAPVEKLEGVELVFCGYSDRNLNFDEMRDFYQGIDIYLCTSSTEGHNNSLMEAAAMECAIVTTPCGTVPEYLEHDKSALIIRRDCADILAAICRLRDNPALRAELGQQARQAAVQVWDWRKRAEDYRAFFRAGLALAARKAAADAGEIWPQGEAYALPAPDPAWLRRHGLSSPQAQPAMAEMLAGIPSQPAFLVYAVADANSDIDLTPLIESCFSQAYPNWRLLILSNQEIPSSLDSPDSPLCWQQMADLSPGAVAQSVARIAADMGADWIGSAAGNQHIDTAALLETARAARATPSAYALTVDRAAGDGSSLHFFKRAGIDALQADGEPLSLPAQQLQGLFTQRFGAQAHAQSPYILSLHTKRCLILFSPRMGGLASICRAKQVQEQLEAGQWGVTLMDLDQTHEENVIAAAEYHGLAYCIGIPFLALYFTLKDNNRTKVVFDLCHPEWISRREGGTWQDLDKILAFADAAVGHDPGTFAYARSHNPVTLLVSSALPQALLPARQLPRPQAHDQERYGWFGTLDDLRGLESALPRIREFLADRRGAELRLLGATDHAFALLDLSGIVHSTVPWTDMAGMLEEMLGWQGALVPRAENAGLSAAEAALLDHLSIPAPQGVVLASSPALQDAAAGQASEHVREQTPLSTFLDQLRSADATTSFATSDPIMSQPSTKGKILIACDFYWPSVGGVETIVANLGETLGQLGYTVEVAARALPNRTENIYRGMPIHSLDANTPAGNGLPRASMQLRDLIEGGEYAGVIMRADPLNWVIWGLEGARVPEHTRVLVQPLINEDGYAEWGGNPQFRQRLGATLRRAAAVVCLTRSGPDARYMNEEQIPFIHLPNATTPLTAGIDFRETYGFSSQTPLLVHVANLWPVKNHLNLVKTFRELDLDCQLALIGNPSGHIDYVEKVRSLVAGDPRIKLLHGVAGEKVAAAMQAADLVILPSLGEVFPVSIVEAMSHGKAWLATPQCGAANELSGGVIAPLPAFPRAIKNLLADRHTLAKLGELGHSHWRHCNQWPTVAKAWSELVETGTLAAAVEPPAEVWSETQRIRHRVVEDQQTLVSVVIPTKDRPHLLAQALQSLQYQTYRRFEVVVVNDGGCEIENLVDFYSRQFDIVYVRHARSAGAAAARNTALRVAKGDIIAYLDDDDYYLSHHLETVAGALDNPGVDFVYTDAEYVVFKLEDGKPAEKTRARPYQGKPYSRDELLVANYIPTPTWAHRSSLIRQIGYFDESMRILEDWDFLIRAAAVSTFQKIERHTVEVRQALFRSDHTLPAAVQQLPGFKQLYERYPAPNSSVSQLREKLLRGLESPTGPEALAPLSSFEAGYDLWVSKHSIEQIHAQLHAERMLRWPEKPRFVMLLPVQRNDLERLAKTIDSMQQQLYQEWQLIFIADFDAPSEIFEQSDILGWLRLDSLEEEEQLVNACNSVIEAIPSDWVALLPPGIELEGNTLLSLGDYALLHPEWQAVYTDHDHVTAAGQRQDPWFKPDFNLDYFRSMDYIGPCIWFRTTALKELGGFNAFPGAWQYDALWRTHDRCGAMAIGHIAEPLLHLPSGLPEHAMVNAARQVALESHLARQGVQAPVLAGLLPGTYRVDYPLAATPLVSVIIPNRDCVWYLQPCIDSLFEKTDYPNFEVVVVDNQTQDPDTLAYYEEIKDRHGERVRIVAYDQPFNFSAQCNLGAAESRGEYLLLLNNDTEIIQSAWLSRMVAHGLRPEVGVVGARLVFPESGKIQHAGVVLGLDRLASHGFMHLDMNDNGYMNRLQVEQDYSAVTAACMLVRKSVFEAVGGMDAEHAPVLFNDVDFCLKVREQGQLVVWTPYVTLVHHESKSISTDMQELQKRAAAAKRDEATADALHRRWHDWLREDPAYNRHLALFTNKSFHVEYELVADWDCNFHDRPRILSFPIAGGVGEYRFIAPLKGLANVGRLHPTIVQTKKYHEVRYPTLPELNRLAPDILMQQVDYSPSFREWQSFYRKHRPEMLSIIMIDDLITQMPKDNPNYRIVPRDSRQRLRKVFSQTDRAIVSTEPLLDFVRDMVADVRLVPNTLRDDLWRHLTSERRTGKKPRVGWAGAQQHKGDLALIVEAVKQTASEVDWIFFGMCPDEIRPYVKEYHHFEVGVEAYPAKLASLNLDLAVAPLEQHPFNEAKSNLRLLEYGVLGLPVICTDVLPYRTNNAPVKRVANETGAWVEAIRERAHDLDAAAREGDILKQWVLKNYMLSDHLDAWFKALTDPRK